MNKEKINKLKVIIQKLEKQYSDLEEKNPVPSYFLKKKLEAKTRLLITLHLKCFNEEMKNPSPSLVIEIKKSQKRMADTCIKIEQDRYQFYPTEESLHFRYNERNIH